MLFVMKVFVIGYDTKLKKAVFLDKDDMRIIYPEW